MIIIVNLGNLRKILRKFIHMRDAIMNFVVLLLPILLIKSKVFKDLNEGAYSS